MVWPTVKTALTSGFRKTKTKCQKRMTRIKIRLKGASDGEPLFSRKDSKRGSQMKNSMCQTNSTSNPALKVVRAALIILNCGYTCDDYSDLNGVNADGDKMEEMLSAHDYTVEIMRNISDIEQAVKDFCKKYIHAETLHFHFSGHGVDNATVEIKPSSYIMNKVGKTFVGVSPAGDCMVGSNGDLYAVHDLKYELMDSKPRRVTVTLDCCRNSRGVKEFVKLRHRRKISTSDQQNIAVIYGTSDLHKASDTNTFTQELYKIYNEEGLAIPILQIVRKVNQSWKDRGIRQICNSDIVEVGDNWMNYKWPGNNSVQTNSKNNLVDDATEDCEEEPEFNISDDKVKIMWKQMNDRMTKLEDENKKLKLDISELSANNPTKNIKQVVISRIPSKVKKMSFRIANNANS